MKKITFNTLPEAISELIVRIEKIEKILSKKPSQSKAKPAPDKRRRRKGQETPAGLLSVKEAGKFLKMSLVNLYSYVKNKKIPFEKRGRRLYFSKTALDNWAKNRNQSAVSGDNITIKDAVKLMKVPAATIYYKIKSQKIKPTLKRGNKLFFSKKELINAFVKTGKRGRKAVTPAKPAKKAKPAKAPKAVKAKAPKAAKVKAAKAAKASKPGRVPKTAKPVVNAVKTAPKVKAAKTAKPRKAVKAVKPPKPAKPAKAVKPPKTETMPAPEAERPAESIQPAPKNDMPATNGNKE